MLDKLFGLEQNEEDQKDHNNKIFGLISSDKLKKFGVPAAMVFAGVILGGIVAQGIYVGILTTGGVWITLDQMRESCPEYYNWLMDHAISADFVLSAIACFGLGFSVTGLIGAAVVNILVGITLEWHRDMYGKVKDANGVEIPNAKATDFIKAIFSSILGFFKSIFGFGKKKEETKKEVVAPIHGTTIPEVTTVNSIKSVNVEQPAALAA